MKENNKKFKVPNNIFELGLKPNELTVLIYIASCSNNKTKALISYNEISNECNIGLSTSKMIINSLIKKGLIVKEKRTLNNNGNNSNAYSLTEKVFDKSKL